MVSIERGMTRDQVVDLIGPPLSTMSRDEFRALYHSMGDLGMPQRRGLLDRLRRRPLPRPRSEPISWYYAGFPDGQSTTISFRRGVVDAVTSSPHKRVQASPQHEWARELVVAHVGRAEASGQRVTASAAWHRLASAEVMDFVLDADDNAYPPTPGRIGGNARQFGDLTVLVSMFKVTRPQQIRRLLPGGYMSQFFWLLDQFCVRLGESDVAHWTLCRENAHKTVHLSYLPAETEGMSALLPIDLLSGKERRGHLR
ncbi:hypothetical protein ABGB07_04360 [Micromonosporaceae bacterium B7E4]